MGQNNIDDWNWMIQIRNRMIVIESMKCLAQLRGSQVYYWLTQLAGRLSKPVMLYVTVSWVSSRDNDRACCKSKANTTTDNSESDTWLWHSISECVDGWPSCTQPWLKSEFNVTLDKWACSVFTRFLQENYLNQLYHAQLINQGERWFSFNSGGSAVQLHQETLASFCEIRIRVFEVSRTGIGLILEAM